jgi:ankyrin repeat protein
MSSPKKTALVALLRRHGASPSQSLIAAHDAETARVLLGMGADPNAPVGSGGETPLAYQSTIGNAELVRFLLEHGGDPTVRDDQGQTILEQVDDAAGNHPGQAAEYGQVRALITRALAARDQRSNPR